MSWKVYSQKTVRPFSQRLEGRFEDIDKARNFAIGLRATFVGKVELVNPEGFTIESWGMPGPDEERAAP